MELLLQVNEGVKASQATTDPKVNLDDPEPPVGRARRVGVGYRACLDSSASLALLDFR